jgi:hypothetical protein
MVIGSCHLCTYERELQDSHVWPRFAYKRYASDLKKGGRFADLFKQQLSNEQYTEFWFCKHCEGLFGETAAGVLCDRIDRNPNASQSYDSDFLRFATSISWRTLKFFFKDRSNQSLESEWPGARQWRRYLLGKEVGVKAFSQHTFLISDNPQGFDKMLGGTVFRKLGIVFSQVGPLLFVGHLRPDLLSADEKITWKKSQISRLGATIQPLRAWKLGLSYPAGQNVTVRFAVLLGLHQQEVRKKVASGKWA